MANTWLFLTLPLTGRQEDPAIKADMLLAIPLQRLVQRYRNHIAGIYQPFPNEKNLQPPPPLPSLFKVIGEMIDLSKEVSSQSCILDPEALLVLQGLKRTA